MDSARIHEHYAAGTITDKEREALYLHHVKGLSYRQIAIGLGRAVSTIADRVKRAHQKIHLAERSNAA